MYTEIVLNTELCWAEALSDALLEAGALAASIEDAAAGQSSEEPLFGEPGGDPPQQGWRSSRIIALFDDTAEIEPLLNSAGRACGLPTLPEWSARPVPENDWVRLTQAQFAPIQVGGKLWIVPSWHSLPAEIDDRSIVLQLDPGLAFGTGAHPTTRLCLAWLEQNVGPGQSVIDYGCGSGILAIAAKKLGAGIVRGTDIDPQALRASVDNAKCNGCDVTFEASASWQEEVADIVVANILANPLKVLAPLLCRLVAPGGSLVLSGVLERQTEDLVRLYRPWMELTVWREDEGWVCLTGHVPKGVVPKRVIFQGVDS